MAHGPLQSTLHHLRSLVTAPDAVGLADAELLERFLGRRDEAAFEVLVRRHGPMVLNVCRRVLHDPHDVEDAFQATFLVFVRRAAAIARRELLGNWLYGVAYHTARAARAAAGRRRAKEARVVPRQQPPDADDWRELRPLLDEELSHLPAKYRIPLILCDLEGKSRRQAAQELGLPAGTLSSRLARGRGLLARRLTRRGVTVTTAALAAALCRQTATAALLPSLVVPTIQAGTRVLADQALAAGAVSPAVAVLTKGVLRAMFVNKFKTIAAVVLLGTLLAAGLGEVASHNLRAQAPANFGGPRNNTPAPGKAVVSYALKYLRAEDVAREFPHLFRGKDQGGKGPAGDVVVGVDDRTNTLTVTADLEDLQAALKLLREVDKPAARPDAPLPERVTRLENELQQWEDRVKRLEKEMSEMRVQTQRDKVQHLYDKPAAK
jgi:RNA polymerase sigma factor (sigma-70 family)